MRQQYHSRELNGNTHIWNVNKLVTEMAYREAEEVSLADIKELDEAYWFGAYNDTKPTCRIIADHAKLIAEADLQYPVLLCPDKRVIDGMHRICKAYLGGHKTIKAIILPSMPAPDYMNKNLEELPYD